MCSKNNNIDDSDGFDGLDISLTNATDLNTELRSGFVALTGRPNAGKSTLLNAVMGEKFAITSNVAQTTRHRLRAIYDDDDSQIILVDTPGIHKPHDSLGEELNHSAIQGITDVDVIAFLLDASKPVGKGDIFVLNQLKAARESAKVLVVNKADKVSQKEAQAQVSRASEHLKFNDVVVCSALTGFNVDGFLQTIKGLLPLGPRWFPKGTQTDQPIEVIVAEFIREKILRSSYDEVPHAVGVMVDDMEYKEVSDLYRIFATIYVERNSQKGIIIGSKGENIKKIGIDARKDLEYFLGTRCFLDLNVKVKKNWRRDASQIRRFGYGEGL